jgi:hypothetical protein
MSKSKKTKKLPKDVEQLTGDEVMEAVFGKRIQKDLKDSANPPDHNTTEDEPPPRLTR